MKKMICPDCKANDAVLDLYWGFLPCRACRDAQRRLKRPGRTIEFTSQSIKDQRKEHRPDMIQPFNRGELSKEYLDEQRKHGRKLNIKVTPEEVKKAKNVWKGTDAVGYYD